MTKPQISVIITNYNRADLLAEAIDSVLQQDFHDYELIIADDGSEDHSLQVIETAREKHPERIHLLMHDDHANKGVVSTYKLAISQARGQLIAFLEHDDRWSPGYLEAKVRIFEQRPEAAVVFSPYRIVGKGWFGRDMTLRRWLLRPTIKAGKPFDNFPNLLQSNNIATFSCFMIRKESLEGTPEAPNDILAYDWWILAHVAIRGLFYYDSSSFTYWRWSKQSTIGRQTFEAHREQGCAFMETLYQQLDDDSHQFGKQQSETFTRYKENFSYFLRFYRRPGLVNFGKFLVRAPIWTMASIASLIINFIKFR